MFKPFHFTLSLWSLGIITMSLLTTFFSTRKYKKLESNSENAKELSKAIFDTCLIFLKRQFQICGIFFGVLFVTLIIIDTIAHLNYLIPFSILIGALTSGFLGYWGFKLSTNSVEKLITQVGSSLGQSYNYLHHNGQFIMTFVVGFLLLDISIWYIVLDFIYEFNFLGVGEPLAKHLGYATWTHEVEVSTDYANLANLHIMEVLLGYVVGASFTALFTRAGGGIFATTNDVSADYVGHVEYDLPEDDLRNPASLPDQAGDQIKKTVGASTSLNASLLISIITTGAFGAFIGLQDHAHDSFINIIAPLLVATLGLLSSSLISIFFKPKSDNIDKLIRQRFRKVVLTILSSTILVFLLTEYQLLPWDAFPSFVIGSVIGLFLYITTAIFTSIKFPFTRKVTEHSKVGPISTILSGLSMGMTAAVLYAVTLSIGITVVFFLTGSALDIYHDLFHIGFMSIGLICTTFSILADAQSSAISDNAAACQEMLMADKSQIKNLHILSTLGNVSQTFLKILSGATAILNLLLLMFFYLISIKKWLIFFVNHSAMGTFQMPGWILTNNEALAAITPTAHHTSELSLIHIIDFFNIHFLNPEFIIGLFIGGGFIFLITAGIFKAVQTGVTTLTHNMRSQLNDNNEIWEGNQLPDYFAPTILSSKNAFKWMMILSSSAVIAPIITSFTIGVSGTVAFVLGSSIIAVILSFCLTVAGGIWNNAKTYLTNINQEERGTSSHVAIMFSDVLGDIFKDATAPTLLILIQVLTIITIIIAPLAIEFEHLISL